MKENKEIAAIIASREAIMVEKKLTSKAALLLQRNETLTITV
ncbi:MAG TPA: hypothetical protein VMU78_01060 [Methylocella sp.]|nr:hypothetical protein [Methylocella sp.]